MEPCALKQTALHLQYFLFLFLGICPLSFTAPYDVRLTQTFSFLKGKQVRQNHMWFFLSVTRQKKKTVQLDELR